MFKIIMAGVSFLLATPAQANEPFSDCSLTKEQESVVRFSYEFGKPVDLGYTMVAIAMRESHLGKYRINLSDPSAGVYHTTIDKGVTKLGWADNGFNRNRVAQRMADDIYFAADIALDTLVWWMAHHNGDWSKAVSGYNGGHRGNPSYVDAIVKNIHTIKRCGWLKEPSVVVYQD